MQGAPWEICGRAWMRCALKVLLFALCSLAAYASAHAKLVAWQPSAGHRQLPIWPGTPPDAQPMPGPETEAVQDHLVAGRPWTAVTNVSQPTMTIYSPKGKNTGAAVVVFPGGGFMVLAIDLEGTEVCHWLTSIGVTCVLLKYRVPSMPDNWKCKCYSHGADALPVSALQDAQRTIRLVRLYAAKWHIDPHKIGVIGFSAGGYLVAETSADFGRPAYASIDAADKQSDRPDFAIAIYPGHMITGQYTADHYDIPVGALNPNVHFTHKTPPTFVIQAEDARTDPVSESLVYYTALAKAGVPAELHIYANGGHAFGLRSTGLPVTRWPRLVETWLHTIGVLEN
ncbi:MAG: alpha/beta hydrolase [Rhodanobacteraceae bacterium]